MGNLPGERKKGIEEEVDQIAVCFYVLYHIEEEPLADSKRQKLSLDLLLRGLFSLWRGLICLGCRPLGCSGPLRLLPGAHITQFTASRALASTTEFLGKVLCGDLSQQFLLVVGAQHVDLLDGDGVEEALDDAENATETPGSVDQVQLTQSLGVVVLRDGRSLANVSVHGGDVSDPNALQVHDCAAGLHQTVGLSRTGGQAGVRQLLVFADQVLQHSFAGGDLVHGVKVDFAQFFDVDGTAILSQISIARSKKRRERTYLVRLVVVLRIKLEDLGLLNVIEVADEIVGAKLFPPFLTVNKPGSNNN